MKPGGRGKGNFRTRNEHGGPIEATRPVGKDRRVSRPLPGSPSAPGAWPEHRPSAVPTAVVHRDGDSGTGVDCCYPDFTFAFGGIADIGWLWPQMGRSRNDPSATFAVHCGNGFDAGQPYQSTHLSRYNAVSPELGSGL
jgi:hypothetical protein